DAFVACKKLGIRYIWIDSLCIIQDNIKDWGKEAARIKDVYSHAKFNISATSTMLGEDGLFFNCEAI
ncbi:heterokaryon incompatibility, partial [Amniculicola lignicola CBS 123094]